MANGSQQREPYQSRRGNASQSNDRGSYQAGQTSRITGTNEEELRAYLEEHKDLIESSIAELARAYMTGDGIIHNLITEAKFKPDFLQAPKEAFLYALIMQARTGLRTGAIHQEAFFSAKGSKDWGCKWIFFDPMYRGLLTLIRRSGKIRDVEARVVYDGDEFSYKHSLTDARLDHVPRIPRKSEVITHAYVIFHFHDGRTHFGVLDETDIERHRKAARENADPWKYHRGEMCKKSVTKSEAKWLDISDDFRAAVEAVNEAETGQLESLAAILPGYEMPALPPSSAETIDAPPADVRDRVAARAAAGGSQPTAPPAGAPAQLPLSDPEPPVDEPRPSGQSVNAEQLDRLKDGAQTPEVAAALDAQAPATAPPPSRPSAGPDDFIEPAQVRHLGTMADRWQLTDAEVNEYLGWLGVEEFSVITRRLHERAQILLEIRYLLQRTKATIDIALNHYRVKEVRYLSDDQIKACLKQLRSKASSDATAQTRK